VQAIAIKLQQDYTNTCSLWRGDVKILLSELGFSGLKMIVVFVIVVVVVVMVINVSAKRISDDRLITHLLWSLCKK
jgi:signal transduction histidine kinase